MNKKDKIEEVQKYLVQLEAQAFRTLEARDNLTMQLNQLNELVKQKRNEINEISKEESVEDEQPTEPEAA